MPKDYKDDEFGAVTVVDGLRSSTDDTPISIGDIGSSDLSEGDVESIVGQLLSAADLSDSDIDSISFEDPDGDGTNSVIFEGPDQVTSLPLDSLTIPDGASPTTGQVVQVNSNGDGFTLGTVDTGGNENVSAVDRAILDNGTVTAVGGGVDGNGRVAIDERIAVDVPDGQPLELDWEVVAPGFSYSISFPPDTSLVNDGSAGRTYQVSAGWQTSVDPGDPGTGNDITVSWTAYDPRTTHVSTDVQDHDNDSHTETYATEQFVLDNSGGSGSDDRIIADFEGETPLSGFSGDSDDWQPTTPGHDSQQAIESVASGSEGVLTVESEQTIRDGRVYSFWVRPQSENQDVGIATNVQNVSGHSGNSYYRFGVRADRIELNRYDGGSYNGGPSASISFTAGEWYRFEVEVGTDELQYRGFDTDGTTELNSLSWSDTTHTGGHLAIASFRMGAIDSVVKPDIGSIEDTDTHADVTDGSTVVTNPESVQFDGATVSGTNNGSANVSIPTGGSGTATTTTVNTSPQNAPDGSTTRFTFAHDHPTRPQGVVPVPRSRAATGLPMLVSKAADGVTLDLSAAPASGTSIVYDLICLGDGTPQGPVTIADFESGSLSESFTGDLGDGSNIYIRTGRSYDDSSALVLKEYNNDDRVILTNETYAVDDRTFRVRNRGTGFGSLSEFGIACSGTGWGDLTGYVARTDTYTGKDRFRISRFDDGVETVLYSNGSAGIPEDPWVILELAVDGATVSGSVRRLDDGTVIDSGSGTDENSDGPLTSGSVALGGDPRSTDAIEVRFDNAEYEPTSN